MYWICPRCYAENVSSEDESPECWWCEGQWEWEEIKEKDDRTQKDS